MLALGREPLFCSSRSRSIVSEHWILVAAADESELCVPIWPHGYAGSSSSKRWRLSCL